MRGCPTILNAALLAVVLSSVFIEVSMCDDSGSPQPWSRSLDNQTVTGFPVSVYHLLLAQDLSLALHAFDIEFGNKVWTTPPLPEALYPFVLEDHHGQGDKPRQIIFQSEHFMFAVDHKTGAVLWRIDGFGAPGSPTYLPRWSHRADTVLTMHADVDVSSEVGLPTGVDVVKGEIQWQHKAFFPLCRDYPSGFQLPVVATESHVFGCFFNTSAGLNTVVEITIKEKHNKEHNDQPPISMRIFNFAPRTVVVTRSFQIIDYKKKLRHAKGPPLASSLDPQPKDKDTVSFIASYFNGKSHTQLVGEPFLISVDANSSKGVIVDRGLSAEGFTTPMQYAQGIVGGRFIASDGSRAVTCFNGLSGEMIWQSVLPFNATLGNKTVRLGPILNLETSEAVVYSQQVLDMSSTSAGGLLVRIATIDPFNGIATHSYFEEQGSDNVNSVVAATKLFIACLLSVAVFNATSGHALLTIPTHQTVFHLDPVVGDGRLIFGTKFAVFSLPLQ